MCLWVCVWVWVVNAWHLYWDEFGSSFRRWEPRLEQQHHVREFCSKLWKFASWVQPSKYLRRVKWHLTLSRDQRSKMKMKSNQTYNLSGDSVGLCFSTFVKTWQYVCLFIVCSIVKFLPFLSLWHSGHPSLYDSVCSRSSLWKPKFKSNLLSTESEDCKICLRVCRFL